MKEKLHHFHVAILIYMIQNGVIIMSLPRLVAQNFGYNGWIALIGLSLVATLNIFLISLVHRFGGGRSIFKLFEDVLPQFLLYPLYAFLTCIWALTGCLVAKNYVYIFQILSYNTTNAIYLMLLIAVLVFLFVIKGIYNLSKATTAFFWLSQWMILLLLFYFKDFEWARMTPFLFAGETHILEGGLSVFSAFLGYELYLLLIPYVDNYKKTMKAVMIGNLLTTFAYVAISIICFGFYSFEQLKHMAYPVLDLLSYIQLPFIERIESLLFGFLVFTTIITTGLYMWSAKETMHRILPKAGEKLLAFLIIGAALAVSWIPDTLSKVQQWLQFLSYSEIAVAFVLPLLLLAILLVRKGARP
ncbi:GerAB/ArcD/ProY family transporter [Paenibacillus arenilitoris]|uniref:GerAB/ArcD/ProY family transporter n=1 Tax=Paenibacillus arenilitoris TaxID=2772299 RepID=A0A927H569_9BACL|nr:GerAB/ArcD/ProY family transporter [Paenibacillus arenilitoris]MBD2868112.1 GerAB/ArcD/ProY family transporter [Paenibacillus arenilitoris]